MVENIVRKREIACYKKFLFSHNAIHNYISLVPQNAALCGNGLIVTLSQVLMTLKDVATGNVV